MIVDAKDLQVADIVEIDGAECHDDLAGLMVSEELVELLRVGDDVVVWQTKADRRVWWQPDERVRILSRATEPVTLIAVACCHCGLSIVDEGGEVWTHDDGDPWCDEDEWQAAAGAAREGESVSDLYDGTYAEPVG
jgi:hypothetical protein